MLWLIVIVVLLLLIVASTPRWPYSRGWGYSPSGVLAALLLIVVVLWLLGVIDITFDDNNNSVTVDVNEDR